MDDLTPVGTVVDFFDLPLSTLHYWERRGLLHPHRVAGRRFYDVNALYRIALIKAWRSTGLMSLEQISTLLGARGSDWRGTVTEHLEEVDEQMARLTAARRYLEHLLTCRTRNGLENCRAYRETVTLPSS